MQKYYRYGKDKTALKEDSANEEIIGFDFGCCFAAGCFNGFCRGRGRISESELKIEFSDSLENAISIVNDVFGTNHHKDNINKVESVGCGRRLLRNNKSTIFSVDFE